jgi:excisionase family DNA binding protein
MGNLKTNQNQPTPLESPVDSRTAAAYLGIHYKVLERMARKREVPAFKVGRSWMFKLSVLSDWLDQKMHSNSQQQEIERAKEREPGK